jgi:hypothetical protein
LDRVIGSPSTTRLPEAAIYQTKPGFFAAEYSAPESKPSRPTDLCPVLRGIRIRVETRLGAVDDDILSLTQAARVDERLVALQRERASLVEALELIATASERGLDREARRRWLLTLLRHAPECVTPKALRRLRHLIEGLRDTAPG